jgi:hypothetical protein
MYSSTLLESISNPAAVVNVPIAIPAASAKGINKGSANAIVNNKSCCVVLRVHLVHLQDDQ